MQIRDDTFYVLELSQEKHAFTQEQEAIQHLKGHANGDTDPSATALYQVTIGNDGWNIQQVQWSKIALQLLQG